MASQRGSIAIITSAWYHNPDHVRLNAPQTGRHNLFYGLYMEQMPVIQYLIDAY